MAKCTLPIYQYRTSSAWQRRGCSEGTFIKDSHGGSLVWYQENPIVHLRNYALFLAVITWFSLDTAYSQTFTDVTASAGISHVQRIFAGGLGPQRMTGGATAGDFDGDGWVDLYVTRLDETDILYRNKGDGTFEDVSIAAGFASQVPSLQKTNGAAAGDVDNDGDLDLYVTAFQTDHFFLYINDGTGVFSEEAVSRGAGVSMDSNFSLSRQGMSVSLGDYDRDGYLDVHTNDWGFRQDGNGQTLSSYSAARLLRNQGSTNPGFFEDTTVSAGVSLHDVPATGVNGLPMTGIWSFSSQLADIDQDGWADLVVAGDFHSSRIFWNNGNGTFTDGTSTSGVGTDENGMGSAVGDYDGDGDLDWFVTSIYDSDDPCNGVTCNWNSSGNRLYRNDGNRQFSDQTDAAGVREGDWGWGAVWLDYDNDGDLDLAMTNGVDFGTINDPQEFDAKFNNDPMRLWRNDGNGTFQEVAVAEGITDTGSGKGLLTFDYDNDGDLDLFVVNNSAAPVLYRNDTITSSGDNGNKWLKIDTQGSQSNRDGIGTRILVDPDDSVVGDEIFQEVGGGSNFLSQSDSTVHFGLGDSVTTIDHLSILWPSGYSQDFYDLAPNQLVTITEGLLADFNSDDSVNDADRMVWESHMGIHSNAMAEDGDADRDGDVDGVDFLLWQRAYGTSITSGISGSVASGSVSVPEPSAMLLVLVAGLLSLSTCPRQDHGVSTSSK